MGGGGEWRQRRRQPGSPGFVYQRGDSSPSFGSSHQKSGTLGAWTAVLQVGGRPSRRGTRCSGNQPGHGETALGLPLHILVPSGPVLPPPGLGHWRMDGDSARLPIAWLVLRRPTSCPYESCA